MQQSDVFLFYADDHSYQVTLRHPFVFLASFNLTCDLYVHDFIDVLPFIFDAELSCVCRN